MTPIPSCHGESAPIDMSRIGLKPREMQVLQRAVWARKQVEHGHYLCLPGQNKAAERLIERGFLTKIPGEFSPPMPDWVVIKITTENFEALRAAEAAFHAPSEKT